MLLFCVVIDDMCVIMCRPITIFLILVGYKTKYIVNVGWQDWSFFMLILCISFILTRESIQLFINIFSEPLKHAYTYTNYSAHLSYTSMFNPFTSVVLNLWDNIDVLKFWKYITVCSKIDYKTDVSRRIYIYIVSKQ